MPICSQCGYRRPVNENGVCDPCVSEIAVEKQEAVEGLCSVVNQLRAFAATGKCTLFTLRDLFISADAHIETYQELTEADGSTSVDLAPFYDTLASMRTQLVESGGKSYYTTVQQSIASSHDPLVREPALVEALDNFHVFLSIAPENALITRIAKIIRTSLVDLRVSIGKTPERVDSSAPKVRSPEEPASDKQISYLLQLGDSIESLQGITKGQAHARIDHYLVLQP